MTFRLWLKKFTHVIGFKPDTLRFSEKLIATIGAAFSIMLIMLLTQALVGAAATLLIVPSLGASAVLLFALPHGPLSQPWAVVGGHGVSAVVGVTCYQWIADPMLAAGMAVGLAVGAMLLTHSLHPPGGATALTAVVGDTSLHELGYAYVFNPILINVALILAAAIMFNALFRWRRYPAGAWLRFSDCAPRAHLHARHILDTRHIDAALRDMDEMIDVDVQELQRLFSLAALRAEQSPLSAQQILNGRYYSNGKKGAEAEIRQILEISTRESIEMDKVSYHSINPSKKSKDKAMCSRAEFAQWAAHEVFPTSDK
jgi:CBS domain-containing membrane protein